MKTAVSSLVLGCWISFHRPLPGRRRHPGAAHVFYARRNACADAMCSASALVARSCLVEQLEQIGLGFLH
ncbi:MAG: hypothetical protein ABI040_08060, partial [Rhodoferax sp.]